MNTIKKIVSSSNQDTNEEEVVEYLASRYRENDLDPVVGYISENLGLDVSKRDIVEVLWSYGKVVDFDSLFEDTKRKYELDNTAIDNRYNFSNKCEYHELLRERGILTNEMAKRESEMRDIVLENQFALY